MSARNKQRGYEHEREIVLWAQGHGLDCRRIFGSGAFKKVLGEDYAGDIVIEGLRLEAKRRKTGFKNIYDAFDQDDSDVVCVRADRKERLWVVKDDLMLKFLK